MIKSAGVIGDKVFGVETGLVKVLLLPVVVTMVGIWAVMAIIVPKIGEIGDNVRGLEKIKQQKKLLLSRKSYYLTLDEEELKKNTDLLAKALLKEDNAYYLVGIIRNIASRCQYSVQNFSISIGELGGEDKKSADFSKIPVSLSVIGPKERSMELIKSLEKSLPLLALDRYEQRNTSSGLTELNLVVSSYYLKGTGALDIAKLEINELTLKEEEAGLIKDLTNYQVVEMSSGLVLDEQKREFTRYQRGNPFSF